MIDWQLLVVALRTHYKPVTVISRELSINYQHLEKIATGDVKEPKFSSGVRLLDLAYDHLPPEIFERIRIG